MGTKSTGLKIYVPVYILIVLVLNNAHAVDGGSDMVDFKTSTEFVGEREAERL